MTNTYALVWSPLPSLWAKVNQRSYRVLGQKVIFTKKERRQGSCLFKDRVLSSSSYPDAWRRQGIVSVLFLSFFTLTLAASGYCFCPVSFFLLLTLPMHGRVLFLSSFFFLSFFCHANNSDMPWPISTKFGHNNPYYRQHLSYDQNGVKGHVGVTGVKNVNHVKQIKLPSNSKLITSSCRQ